MEDTIPHDNCFSQLFVPIYKQVWICIQLFKVLKEHIILYDSAANEETQCILPDVHYVLNCCSFQLIDLSCEWDSQKSNWHTADSV